MPFFHFSSYGKPNKKNNEPIIIHLEDPILIEDELEEHIRTALKNGTLERTQFIVPGVIGLNLSTGKGSPNKLISDEALSEMINSIVKKIKGE
jgi:hypothetical protein